MQIPTTYYSSVMWTLHSLWAHGTIAFFLKRGVRIFNILTINPVGIGINGGKKDLKSPRKSNYFFLQDWHFTPFVSPNNQISLHLEVPDNCSTGPTPRVYHSCHHATDGGMQQRYQRCNLPKKTYPPKWRPLKLKILLTGFLKPFLKDAIQMVGCSF